jgi:hypothetical protein
MWSVFTFCKFLVVNVQSMLIVYVYSSILENITNHMWSIIAQ